VSALDALWFAGGVALLVAGAEALVRGACRAAAALGVSPLLAGLTVVAYGTSAPEVAVSLGSIAAGGSAADIAVGNVVGSNIFNVLFILGLSAVAVPLVVERQLVRFDVPIMIAVSLLLAFLVRDGTLEPGSSVLLLAVSAGYTVLLVRLARRTRADALQREAATAPPTTGRDWALTAGLVLLGLVLLVVGARSLVASAMLFARWLGVSELVIGLTVVAAGTSLPELATSVVAALRGERSLAVGNVVGSNISNLLVVLGISGLAAPAGLRVPESVRHFDLPVMIAAAVACLPIFFTGHRIARWEGLLFLAYYGAYSAYLILAATHHDALPRFSAVMLQFVGPLTAVTLAVVSARALQLGRREARSARTPGR